MVTRAGSWGYLYLRDTPIERTQKPESVIPSHGPDDEWQQYSIMRSLHTTGLDPWARRIVIEKHILTVIFRSSGEYNAPTEEKS